MHDNVDMNKRNVIRIISVRCIDLHWLVWLLIFFFNQFYYCSTFPSRVRDFFSLSAFFIDSFSLEFYTWIYILWCFKNLFNRLIYTHAFHTFIFKYIHSMVLFAFTALCVDVFIAVHSIVVSCSWFFFFFIQRLDERVYMCGMLVSAHWFCGCTLMYFSFTPIKYRMRSINTDTKRIYSVSKIAARVKKFVNWATRRRRSLHRWQIAHNYRVYGLKRVSTF